MNKENICIHFIIDNIGIHKEYASHVPRPKDEVRFGGEGHEEYFTVSRIVWVYDEPESHFDRVNIGLVRAK